MPNPRPNPREYLVKRPPRAQYRWQVRHLLCRNRFPHYCSCCLHNDCCNSYILSGAALDADLAQWPVTEVGSRRGLFVLQWVGTHFLPAWDPPLLLPVTVLTSLSHWALIYHGEADALESREGCTMGGRSSWLFAKFYFLNVIYCIVYT
jgi:hypothetical protein